MNSIILNPGLTIGRLTLISPCGKRKWHCICSCGNHSYPFSSNLKRGLSTSCGNCGKNYYRDLDDDVVEVISTNGIPFYIDKCDEALVRTYKWHVCTNQNGYHVVMNSARVKLYTLLLGAKPGTEVDHIDLNPLNNCRNNIRITTHQENQINHPLQSNNSSGVSGVSYYPPRGKYRARIKIGQHDIHLGYYPTFQHAVQARNVGMECMFGEYGRYNDVPPAPPWIRNKVVEQCKRFAELSVCKAFFSGHEENGKEVSPGGDQRKKAAADGDQDLGRRSGEGTQTH